jgi:hypothetical protein
MRHLRVYLCFVSILFGNFLQAHINGELAQKLFRSNALTIRMVETPPQGIRVSTIEHLVRTIHLHKAVPQHTLLSINGRYFIVHRGIELHNQDKKVFIFSRGYAKTTQPGTNDDFIQRGAAAKAAFIQLQDSIVPHDYPLVSFDYDDGRNGFAFGQRKEINTLQTIYQSVLHKNPTIGIILIGDCRGGKVALEVATHKPRNLQALILMAPFISGRDITNNIATQHLKYLPYNKRILHRFFKTYFKTYNDKQDNLAQRLSYIDPELPIYIAHRANDELISTNTINTIVSSLRQSGNKNVHLLVTNDTSESHSKLTDIPEIQYGIAQFMHQYDILSRSLKLTNSNN